MRWPLSYRVRAIVLVALLACGAIAATAFVSARSTVTQVSSSEDSRQNDIDLITSQLTNYGMVHGTWVGVASLALTLEQETSQRIKLTTQDGEVIVDTDTLHGEVARETSGRSPVAIVPRPTLDLQNLDYHTAYDTTLLSITTYRSDERMAACLTEAEVPVSSTPGQYGIANIVYDSTAAGSASCVRGTTTPQEESDDESAAQHCLVDLKLSSKQGIPSATALPVMAEMRNCLSTVFQQRTASSDAVTLLLYVGFRGAPTLHVEPKPILYAAIPIVLLAILFAGLLSRHVLRPVDAVVRASRRLEAGHRNTRVPERGRDEMALLARSFNRMVDSVQASEAQQRQMVADIAHELRTPLANIRGYLEALKDGVLAPSPDIFESLHEEALLQQRIIDDLQDLALADRDRLIDYRVRTDLAELVRTARAAHAARADASSITLSVETADDLYVDGDPDRLRQALGNLLTNALRATDKGGRIAVTAARTDVSHILMTVADTGRGIAPEHLPHIFDRFWRADPSRARGTGGSGLGLAITSAIVRGHGGTVAVESTVGVGTTFTITLPASEP